MDIEVVHARLSREIVAALDQRAADELRSRSNLAAYLIREGLDRRETADKEA